MVKAVSWNPFGIESTEEEDSRSTYQSSTYSYLLITIDDQKSMEMHGLNRTQQKRDEIHGWKKIYGFLRSTERTLINQANCGLSVCRDFHVVPPNWCAVEHLTSINNHIFFIQTKLTIQKSYFNLNQIIDDQYSSPWIKESCNIFLQNLKKKSENLYKRRSNTHI
jgi:hypothetical protein